MKQRKRIWIPEFIEETIPIIELPPIGIGGYFYVDLIDAKTLHVKQHLEFPNVITNSGLNLLGTGTKLDDMFIECQIGSGNSTPDVTDVILDALIASSSDSGGNDDVNLTESIPVEFALKRRTRIFPEDVGNGSLREVGFSTSGTLSNRALFTDLNGNPTTIEKTDNDFLRVVYETRLFAPLNDVTGTIPSSALRTGTIDYTIRAQNVNQSNGWPDLLGSMGSYADPFAKVHESAVLGSRTANNDPSPNDEETTSSLSEYTSSNFFRDMTYEWRFTDGNFAGLINTVTWNPWHSGSSLGIWQMHLSQSIEKDAQNRIEITFRQRWTRV